VFISSDNHDNEKEEIWIKRLEGAMVVFHTRI
jgi:hypothetical protein